MVNRSLKQDPVFESPRVRKEEGGQILTLKPTVMEAGGGGTGVESCRCCQAQRHHDLREGPCHSRPHPYNSTETGSFFHLAH